MRSRLVQFLAISITVVPLAAASAQEISVDESGTPDAPEAKATQEFKDSLSANRMFGGDAREMRLAEAVRLGIENNLNLKIQRHDPLIAFEDQEGAWGSYDPLFTAQGGWAEAREPNTNVLTGSGSDIRSQTKVIDAEAEG